MQMCKVSDWFSNMPHCFQWPQTSVGNVIVNGKDLCEVTLYNMLNFIYFNIDLNLCLGDIPNTQYATMWFPLHTQVQYSAHTSYFYSFYLLACSL